MSAFDPNAFLDTQFTEANATQVIPVPVGDYLGVATEVKVRPWQSKVDPSKAGLALDVIWEIDDQGVKELLGRDKVTVKHGILLDLTDSGTLDMGKGRNVALGKFRTAVDLNTPGQPFAFTMIPGRVAKISVGHRVDGDSIFAEVKAVARP